MHKETVHYYQVRGYSFFPAVIVEEEEEEVRPQMIYG
jgi:hypothetical protein